MKKESEKKPPFHFGSKAGVLKQLYHSKFHVPCPYSFTIKMWGNSPESCMDHCRKALPSCETVAVRSSCINEDSIHQSMAGAYTSVLHVALQNNDSLKSAILKVINSYGDASPSDQVLIQPMVENVVMSGVIMTRHLEDGAPYYVVNYDDESGSTESVTAGNKISKTVFIYRNFRDDDFDSPRLLRLLQFVRKLEQHTGSDAIDVEFAMEEDLSFHILQVRPIATQSSWNSSTQSHVEECIAFVEEYIGNISTPRPGIFGHSTILGVMPDWNPAEIIGITPRPLATSLYRYIITQRVWSYAREEMGYRHMPPEELMLLVAGRPYIDVRNSFNSFLPPDLSEGVAHKLVDSWLERLDAHPEFHDKIEFEIVSTILDFNFDKEFQERYPKTLNKKEFQEYRNSLLILTNRLLDSNAPFGLSACLGKIQSLAALQHRRNPTKNAHQTLAQVKELLEDCKLLGTLPFSIIARHAFIAEALLRSAVKRGAISNKRIDAFKNSIRTISRDYGSDLYKVQEDEMSHELFLDTYGHLRPGTYDILSPSYRDRSENLLLLGNLSRPPLIAKFEASPHELEALNRLLREYHPSINAHKLLSYAHDAIAAREYAKFIFTRHLSDALESIAHWGTQVGLHREELSWLQISDILTTLTQPAITDSHSHFRPLIQQGQQTWQAGQSLKLGYLIRSARDVYVFPQHRSTPNFITAKRVQGHVIHLKPTDNDNQMLEGAIICIQNADPGFDWIFTRNFAGLVTQYGGANSHMAIRCSEYSIPAAIGCGELLFKKITASVRCELDSEKKILRPQEHAS